jgi:predicted HD phosphohydrolase
MDYQRELETYKDSLSDDEKKELSKLAGMQKDIAVGESAEDFIRHPFFRAFEQQINLMISDANVAIAAILVKPLTPEQKVAEMQAHQAGIEQIKKLKRWLNKHVIAGRVARQAVTIYEEDTEKMNNRIQEAVDKSNQA